MVSDTGTVKIYDDIFEAFKVFAPYSPLLELEHSCEHFFRPSNRYELMGLEDGTIGAFPSMPFMQYYRGEPDDYPTSEASIFRNHKRKDGSYDEIGILADELKIIDFKNILLTFPQVQFAQQDHANVDFLALAQHYELNTPLLDITSAPEIAAYFATQKWVNGIPTPISDGVGCIMGLIPPLAPPEQQGWRIYSEKFHMIGLQCFQRPGLQFAFGLESELGEDFAHRGRRVLFRQTADASSRIYANFHYDPKTNSMMKYGCLFPREEITDVARLIKNARTVTNSAVEERCRETGEDSAAVIQLLSTIGYKVVDQPIFTLSPDRVSELTKEYDGRPYGDVELTTRLTYI